jgi:hypothetical protein
MLNFIASVILSATFTPETSDAISYIEIQQPCTLTYQQDYSGTWRRSYVVEFDGTVAIDAFAGAGKPIRWLINAGDRFTLRTWAQAYQPFEVRFMNPEPCTVGILGIGIILARRHR